MRTNNNKNARQVARIHVTSLSTSTFPHILSADMTNMTAFPKHRFPHLQSTPVCKTPQLQNSLQQTLNVGRIDRKQPNDKLHHNQQSQHKPIINNNGNKHQMMNAAQPIRKAIIATTGKPIAVAAEAMNNNSPLRNATHRNGQQQHRVQNVEGTEEAGNKCHWLKHVDKSFR